MPNDICGRHPDAAPARSHLGRYCPECLRESFENHADIEAAQAALAEPGERKTLAEVEAVISTKH